MTISKTIERVANICILKKLSVFGLNIYTYMNIQRFKINLRKKRTTVFLLAIIEGNCLKWEMSRKMDIEEE